jgi:hypothetical protein
MPGRSLADAARDDRHRLSRALHRPGDVAAQFGQQNAKSPLVDGVVDAAAPARRATPTFGKRAGLDECLCVLAPDGHGFYGKDESEQSI